MATLATPDAVLLDLVLAVRREAEARRDDTRGRILVEAIRLFAGNGYAGTSMRDIAAAVGIRAASIYAHYASKQELLGEALAEVLHRFQVGLVDVAEAGLPPAALLERLVRQHVRWQVHDPALTRSWDLLWELEGAGRNLDPEVRAEIATRRARHHALVAALVGALRPADPAPALRAEALLGLCDCAATWALDADGAPLPSAAAEDACWELARALLGEPGRVADGRPDG